MMIYKKSLPIILFVVTSSILLIAAYPAIGWWDSGYYAACVNGLGIPGQGGSILYVLLGGFFSLIFFFLPAIKAITLASILSTALAAVFFYTLAKRFKTWLIIALYGNFRAAFLQLAHHHFRNGDAEKSRKIFEAMNDKLPQWRFSDSQNIIVKNFEKMLYSERE